MTPHRPSEDLAREIVAGWPRANRNYFAVVPPLNRAELLFHPLRDPALAKSLHGDASDNLAIAYCPHGLIGNSNGLVQRACGHWNITPTPDRSYQWQLENAVTKLRDQGRIPVLLLPGFYRIVLDLPEELGAVLRDLNQSAGLLCVAEVPLKWHTLIERWRNEGRTGLINSDFGQGYLHKPVLGYLPDEIDSLLSQRSLSLRWRETIYEMTGGAHHWVDRLLGEATAQPNPQKWSDVLLDSPEFVGGFLKYLDPGQSNVNRSAIARHFLGIATLEDLAALNGHDWQEFLLDDNGRLRSSVVGSGCARRFGLHPSQSLEKTVTRLIRNGSYRQACEAIELSGHEQGILRRHHLIAKTAELVNSGGDEWSRIFQTLLELEKSSAQESGSGPNPIPAWKDFASRMRTACQAKHGANSDPIGCCCGRGGGTPDPLSALRLVAVRLSSAEAINSPLLATQTILAIPEALIQLYCAIKLSLLYWEPPPPDAEVLATIRTLPFKADFEWPPPDKALSFGQLLTLGWSRMQRLPLQERLTADYTGLDQLQQLYTQDRNPLSHLLTFSNQKQWRRYASECRGLFSRIADILVPSIPKPDLALPPLDALLDAATTPSSLSQKPSVILSVAVGSPTGQEPKDLFALSHYLVTHTLSGGMSGSAVKLIEYRDSKDTPLRIGILKVTTKAADFDRECQGSLKAQACWLKDHVADTPRSAKSGSTGYILSPLAFDATSNRRIRNLHDLLVAGEDPWRISEVFGGLGEVYGAALAVAELKPGTPQEHFSRIWEHWREAAAGFDWAKWRFPGREEIRFADVDRNWVNPLACVDNPDCWRSYGTISLAWVWQHRDLNTRNVLVSPEATSAGNEPPEFRFIDLEKVSESSALLDLCWASLWALQAGAERAGRVRDHTWDTLPDSFLRRTLRQLSRDTDEDGEPDLDVFQLSLNCVAAAFRSLRVSARCIKDPVILQEMYEITLGAAALAKCFYELRDLQRAADAREQDLIERWQRARCFFRISTRSLQPFLVSPRGGASTDLGLIPDPISGPAT